LFNKNFRFYHSFLKYFTKHAEILNNVVYLGRKSVVLIPSNLWLLAVWTGMKILTWRQKHKYRKLHRETATLDSTERTPRICSEGGH